MRKLLLVVVCGLVGTGLFAQSIEDVQKTWLLGQVKKAKEEVDKGMNNAKFSAKAEAWLLKASIYSALAGDKDMAAQSDALMQEAVNAFNTYKQKDPEFKILKGENSLYSGTPGNIYTAYFNNGIAGYNKKDWAAAAKQFKLAVEMSDFLIAQKMIAIPVDTNALLLAGASSQNAENGDDAVKYYSRLADIKVAGEENEFIYPYMVEHYMKKGDVANRDKYLAIGRQLYPKNPYWCNIPLIEAGEDTLKIMDAYEKMITSDCADNITYYEYAREIYNYIHFGKSKPQDPAKYEKRMIEVLKKSIELKSTPEANLLMCRIHYFPINDLIEEYNNTKGTKPEDVKKRADINAKLNAKYDEMIPYANAAYEIYDAKATLKGGEKANFKIVTNMILEYWTNKKDKEKAKKYEDRMKAIE
ncbi:MAG: hypothetical protein E6H07_15585 [Bacteroidetes bacterium]|nr:MAG: hypothetical protein E6H07_15585 [Bacteroidota bacterium]